MRQQAAATPSRFSRLLHRSNSDGVRPEIQFLRAVAVGVVVLYHIWPHTLRGGFVGVDIFFAISGFLICAHLMRELERTGRIALLGFWARRARRLLPASLLVLAVVAVAVIVAVPQGLWQQFLREIGASALYVQNWILAVDAVDYLAADNQASPVQHFWSLSTEEQFYLVWPILIMAGAGIAWLFRSKREGAVPRYTAPGSKLTVPARRVILAILSVLTLSSLVFSIAYTVSAPAAAYFITPTRAWEFGAGALLAMIAPTVVAGRETLRTIVSWTGWALIAAAVILYTESIPFPSYTAALPVVGTLLVIWAGSPSTRWSPTPIARLRPIQWLGDISYSLYLWHWPIIVISAIVIGYEAGLKTGVAIILVSLGLAWLTKVFIEDPARTRPFLAKARPRRTFLAMVVGIAAVVALSAGGTVVVQQKVDATIAKESNIATTFADCIGGATVALPSGGAPASEDASCASFPDLGHELVPDPLINSEGEEGSLYSCDYKQLGTELHACDLVPGLKNPERTVALVGDSHARQLRPALARVAKKLNWQVVSLSHAGCILADVVRETEEPRKSQCKVWQVEVRKWLADNPQVSYLISANLSDSQVETPKGTPWFDTAVDGYVSEWDNLPSNITHVFVVRDNPRFPDAKRTCMEKAYAADRDVNKQCSSDRSDVLKDDAQAVAAGKAKAGFTSLIDMTDLYCDSDSCWPTLGHVMIFRDNSHVTQIWSVSIAGRLEYEFEKALATL